MHGPGPKEWPDWPFCSKRCKTIDLGRWLSGAYQIPAEDQEETPAAQPDDPETP